MEYVLLKRLITSTLLLVGLVACSAGGPYVPSAQSSGVTRSYDVVAFTFFAPDDLSVSESLEYYPIADIVWRGDPLGPRIPQIAAMFETAVERNEAQLDGVVPAAVDVSLIRFHGVTDRTRYSFGGVYNIVFALTVLDARTGEILEPTRRISANLDAPGRSEAVALEEEGQTQKVRVTDFLTAVLLAELT